MAVARFLGHEFGLGGATNLENGLMDAIVDSVSEATEKQYTAYLFEKVGVLMCMRRSSIFIKKNLHNPQIYIISLNLRVDLLFFCPQNNSGYRIWQPDIRLAKRLDNNGYPVKYAAGSF